MVNTNMARTGTPDLLFHYTSQQGLLGIIAQKAIWASDIHYLNDAAEFAYAQGILYEEIEAIRESISREDAEFIDTEQEFMGAGKGNYVCVSSFSEIGDLLSQWRGYCPTGAGLSIGFDFSLLKQSAGDRLVKCIYDVKEQKHLVRQLLHDTLKVCQLSRSAGASKLGISSHALNYFHQGSHVQFQNISELPISEGFDSIASRLKHPSYSEEREWRVVQRPMPINRYATQAWQFTEGKNTIIPYILFHIPDPMEHPIIREIIAGPTPFPELAIDSVRQFLSCESIQGCRVLNSAIPYRG